MSVVYLGRLCREGLGTGDDHKARSIMTKATSNGFSGISTQKLSSYLDFQDNTRLLWLASWGRSRRAVHFSNSLERLGAELKQFGVVGEVLLVGTAEIFKRSFLQLLDAALCFWP